MTEHDDAYYDLRHERDDLVEENAMLKVKINAMREQATAICSQRTLSEFLAKYPKEII